MIMPGRNKPRGQIFFTPSFSRLFYYIQSSKIVIWLTPFPSTVQVVYGCPFRTYRPFWGKKFVNQRLIVFVETDAGTAKQTK